MSTLDPAKAPRHVHRWLAQLVPVIDAELARWLGQEPGKLDSGPMSGDAAERLRAAVRYAALGPGKRLRPALTLAACESVGGDQRDALPAAAAIEMLHAYTLVHDDLPAMDDDDLRRGRPTVHRAFDEATAILAGDALLTAAFAALATLGRGAADAVAVLAARAGRDQLLAGQARDLARARATAPPPVSFADIEQIHRDKTGALFAAATEMGGIAGGASREQRDLLAEYGLAVGLAFQHADDRDDNAFPEYAEAAAARRAALGERACDLASRLHVRNRPDAAAHLIEIARWFGQAC